MDVQPPRHNNVRPIRPDVDAPLLDHADQLWNAAWRRAATQIAEGKNPGLAVEDAIERLVEQLFALYPRAATGEGRASLRHLVTFAYADLWFYLVEAGR